MHSLILKRSVGLSNQTCFAWRAGQWSTRALACSLATSHTDIGHSFVVFQLLREHAWWTSLPKAVVQYNSKNIMVQAASCDRTSYLFIYLFAVMFNIACQGMSVMSGPLLNLPGTQLCWLRSLASQWSPAAHGHRVRSQENIHSHLGSTSARWLDLLWPTCKSHSAMCLQCSSGQAASCSFPQWASPACRRMPQRRGPRLPSQRWRCYSPELHLRQSGGCLPSTLSRRTVGIPLHDAGTPTAAGMLWAANFCIACSTPHAPAPMKGTHFVKSFRHDGAAHQTPSSQRPE